MDAVLQSLIRRVSPERLIIRCRSQHRATEIDRILWEKPVNSFLPHGLAGGEFDDEQPVLLTWEAHHQPDIKVLLLYEAPECELAEISNVERVLCVFDQRQQAQRERARTLWRTIATTNRSMQFWADDETGWTLKTKS